MKIVKSSAPKIASTRATQSVELVESGSNSVGAEIHSIDTPQNRGTAGHCREVAGPGEITSITGDTPATAAEVVPFLVPNPSMAAVVKFPGDGASKAARRKPGERREKTQLPAQQELALPGAALNISMLNVPARMDEIVAKRGLHSGRDYENGTDEWLTPAYVNDALFIQTFDLDPCAPFPEKLKNLPPGLVPAKNHYCEDGLTKKWFGSVFCNPPYNEVAQWLAKCAEHKNALALVYARTETKWFQSQVWARATAVLFVFGRINFVSLLGKPDAAAVAPSVLIAYNDEMAEHLRKCPLPGFWIKLDLSVQSRETLMHLGLAVA